jgi:hypothetical protein
VATDIHLDQACVSCCVSSSSKLVYVIGGISERSNPLAVAEANNVEEDKWEILPPMVQPHDWGCHGVMRI